MPMLDLYSFILILVFTGIIAGFLAGFLGIGGGIIIVPVLDVIFLRLGTQSEIAFSMAVATSLATIIPTACSSVRSHYYLGNIRPKIYWAWLPAMVLGVLLGSYFVIHFYLDFLIWMFVVVIFLTSMLLYLKSDIASDNPHMPDGDSIKKQTALQGVASRISNIIVPFFIGTFSAMAGLGGGGLGVPMLILMKKMPSHVAIGTASLFGVVVAVTAITVLLISVETPLNAPMGTFSLINIPAFFCIICASIFMANIGAKCGKRISPKTLRITFACLLLIIAIRMLFKGLVG